MSVTEQDQTKKRLKKGQKASYETVAAACDRLFREGKAITELAVRNLLEGGSPPVIYRLIGDWEKEHRRQFLEFEAKAADLDAGRAPPEMPSELWEALKPAWDSAVAQAKAAADANVAHAVQALAADRATLEEESARVRELDARWQAERGEWSETIGALNTQLSAAQAQNEQLSSEIRQLVLREWELKMHLETNQRQAQDRLTQMEAALVDAKSHHEADQARWLQQIDTARQEAKSTIQRAERREADLQRRLDAALGDLADTRIALAATQAESANRLQQTESLRSELAGLRESQAHKDRRIEQLVAEAAERRARSTAGERSTRKPSKGKT